MSAGSLWRREGHGGVREMGQKRLEIAEIFVVDWRIREEWNDRGSGFPLLFFCFLPFFFWMYFVPVVGRQKPWRQVHPMQVGLEEGAVQLDGKARADPNSTASGKSDSGGMRCSGGLKVWSLDGNGRDWTGEKEGGSWANGGEGAGRRALITTAAGTGHLKEPWERLQMSPDAVCYFD